MNEQERAAQNLETIRSMMQRATVYRMISGPTALFAGVASLIACFGIQQFGWLWQSSWFIVLIAVVVANTFLVIAKARREDGVAFSPGLVMGLRAIGPPLLAGAIMTLIVGYENEPGTMRMWILFYGLALIATHPYSPKAMWWLGTSFFGTALVVLILDLVMSSSYLDRPEWWSPDLLMMAITFGGFHLIYGLYVIFIENKRS